MTTHRRSLVSWTLAATIGFLSCSVSAGPVTITNTFSNGTVADADQVNQNFSDVKTAVDDNDARVTTNTTDIGTLKTDVGTLQSDVGTLQSDVTGLKTDVADIQASLAAAGTGRIFVPSGAFLPGNATSVYNTLPDGATTTLSTSIGTPADYVPGGTGDVLFRVLLSGCEGTTARMQFTTRAFVVGSNTNLLILPLTVSVNVPPSSGGILTFQILAHEFTRTGFGDEVQIVITRQGLDAGDTCTGPLTLRGLIVEYPTEGP